MKAACLLNRQTERLLSFLGRNMIEEKPNYTDEEIQNLVKDLAMYKCIAQKRLDSLETIRATIKKHYPDVYGKGCMKPATTEVLDLIFEQAKAVERGRNAFRDELVEKYNYSHQDLVGLMKSQMEKENADTK
jgi:hypothetical protein